MELQMRRQERIYRRDKMMDGMVVFMDQEMAYDRVEWE